MILHKDPRKYVICERFYFMGKHQFEVVFIISTVSTLKSTRIVKIYSKDFPEHILIKINSFFKCLYLFFGQIKIESSEFVSIEINLFIKLLD